MSFVVSEGQVTKLDSIALPPSYSLRVADDFTQDYAAIWRTQHAVRTTVSFLGRNVASIGIHLFRRLSDNDRQRLIDHPAMRVLGRPNPWTTTYRLIDALVHDLGIYDTAYWLKVITDAGTQGVIRMRPEQVTPKGDGIRIAHYEIRGPKGVLTVPAEQMVHFRGYSPDGVVGSSPIEALRRILAEDYEGGRMREQTLRNGARTSGYLERPAAAPAWSDPARETFRKGWKAQYSGNGPEAGGTPILEDGMTFNPASQTAQQLQYVETRALTREEVAAAYFIPPTMVGIMASATFGNIEEQHKMLYQDTLGPWLKMIEDELDLQLLSDFDDTSSDYFEFNLKEKLGGSFEDQASASMSATGAPWMTRNETRALYNLPALEGGDELITPLNVLLGGRAAPNDPAKSAPAGGKKSPAELLGTTAAAGGVSLFAKDRAPETHTVKAAQILTRFFNRQSSVVLSAIGSKANPEWWDAARWDKELADDLFRFALMTSKSVAESTLDSLGVEPDKYDAAQTVKFLEAVAASRAGMINATTRDQLKDAIAAGDEGKSPSDVFDLAKSDRAPSAAETLVTTFSAFATTEAAKQIAGEAATKTWLVTSGSPRASHAAMDGETVGINETFSNGMDWPGDPVGGADEVAGCLCDVQIDIP